MPKTIFQQSTEIFRCSNPTGSGIARHFAAQDYCNLNGASEEALSVVIEHYGAADDEGNTEACCSMWEIFKKYPHPPPSLAEFKEACDRTFLSNAEYMKWQDSKDELGDVTASTSESASQPASAELKQAAVPAEVESDSPATPPDPPIAAAVTALDTVKHAVENPPLDPIQVVRQVVPPRLRESIRRAIEAKSVRGMSDELQRELGDTEMILGNISVRGQVTTIFAKPGSGKTLLILYLVVNAIREGRMDGMTVIFVNADDPAQGVAEKAQIAEEVGFEMLVPGYRQFKAQDVRPLLQQLIDSKQAQYVVIILDTLKKFMDPMHKSEVRKVLDLFRQFSAAGGTLILLAHVNKSPGPDGKPVPAGTADLMDDVDVTYMLDVLHKDNGIKVVEFQRDKTRGKVAERAAFAFSTDPDLTYEQLLASVTPVPDGEADRFRALPAEDATAADEPIIAAINAAIASGTDTRMRLAADVSAAVDCSKRKVLRVLDAFTADAEGDSHSVWRVRRGFRNAKHYELLLPADTPSQEPESEPGSVSRPDDAQEPPGA